MVPLQAENAFSRLSQVKKMIIGGVGMSKTLESRLKTLPTQIYETYGMTETITHIAAKELGEDAFTVLPDVTITYNNKQCLVIHAPRISPEIIQTNDLVELVNENQFRFLGRIDNVVNSGGIKLIPETIEDKISTHFTKRFFVAGVPDEKLGEKLVLIIESEPFEVNQDVFSKLDKYERPKDVLFLPKFEETGTGKIKRTEVMKHLLSN
jgi:O-succinylbenzoic acid--CoA ligase